MERETLLAWAREQYGCQPEYLWLRYPNYAVLRHPGNGKWFGALIDLPREKLGLAGEGWVDLLNVRLEPELAADLRQEPGFLPGYHMNKKNWLSILLDGTVEEERILELLDISYRLVGRQKRK